MNDLKDILFLFGILMILTACHQNISRQGSPSQAKIASTVAGFNDASRHPAILQCEAHHLPLQKDEVKIFYGSAVIPWAVAPCRENSQFPHAKQYELGGCLAEAQAPKTKEVWYCQRCRELERACAIEVSREQLAKLSKTNHRFEKARRP